MVLNTDEKYNALVGLEHRRKFGQFFTPFDVAYFMCKWALETGADEIFDPAIGLGVFYDAAQKVRSTIHFSGVEIDPIILDYLYKEETEKLSFSIMNADYLTSWGDTHAAIVCNPPYMRFQNFLDRDKVFSLFQNKLGLRLSGYTNSASAFLLKSLSELKKGGRLAYIMPLEFLNTGYGTTVKHQLLQNGKLKAIIRLESEKEVFPDAVTSAGIILIWNDGKNDPVRFYSIRSLEVLPDILSSEPKRIVPASELSPENKWFKYFDDTPELTNHKNLVSVNEYGRFSRGIATGANEFFMMSPSRAQQLRIPASCLIKCIAKSNQIKKSIFCMEDMVKLEQDDEEILLLNANGNLPPAAINYIKNGEAQGFNLRYLTKMRSPWYKIEHRTPAPMLFGVFSRDGYKVVRNYSSAINLTCYHGFYPNLFGQRQVDRLFLYFKSRVARQILGLNMRRYGDGLDKFEPNDLNMALAPSSSWFDRMPDDLVQQGLQSCCNNQLLSSDIESLFQSILDV